MIHIVDVSQLMCLACGLTDKSAQTSCVNCKTTVVDEEENLLKTYINDVSLVLTP